MKSFPSEKLTMKYHLPLNIYLRWIVFFGQWSTDFSQSYIFSVLEYQVDTRSLIFMKSPVMAAHCSAPDQGEGHTMAIASYLTHAP